MEDDLTQRFLKQNKTRPKVDVIHFRLTSDFKKEIKKASYIVHGEEMSLSMFIRQACKEKIESILKEGH